MSNQWNSNMSPYQQQRSSCLPMVLVLMVLIAAIGAGVYFLLNKSIDSAMAPLGVVEGPITGTSQPQAVEPPAIAGTILYNSALLAYDRNGDERNEVLVQISHNSQYSMALLDGADGKALWQTDLGSEFYNLLPLDAYIAVIKDRDIRLFNTKDGTFLWHSRLSDRIQINPPMLFIADDLIVIQTYDNILTAYELVTGNQRWQKTLAERYVTHLARLGDELCTTERNPELSLDFIVCYGLKTGEQRQAIQLNNDWTGAWSGLPIHTPMLGFCACAVILIRLCSRRLGLISSNAGVLSLMQRFTIVLRVATSVW